MRARVLLLALLALPACSDDKQSAETPPAFSAADCPVEDTEFCAAATDVANALAARDAEALLAASRLDTIVCAEMNVQYFPGCATQDELRGYGMSGPTLVVDTLAEAEYLDRLRAITDEIDASSLQLLGVGTCGPDIPGQRTYHLSWTAPNSAETVIGSFEMLFVDEWQIVLTYYGTRSDWLAQPTDPLRDGFCEAGRHPWEIPRQAAERLTA